MQYLVTTNKNRIPQAAQIFVVGDGPVGWKPKSGDFQWARDRSNNTNVSIDAMPMMALGANATNLLQHLAEAQPKQCIVSALLDLDVCAAAAWLQLTGEQQQSHRDRLRAIAMDGERLNEHPELTHLHDFAAKAVGVLQQEEIKLLGKVGELLGPVAFWSGGFVHLQQLNLEGQITHVHVNDRCVEVDCGLDGVHLSNYWNTTFPSDRSRWSDYQRESYASLVFRVQAEWLVAACWGNRLWPGEQKIAISQSE
jgi:hypothetical protein